MCCRRCGPNPRLRSAGGKTSVAMPHTVNAGGPDEALHDMLTQSVSNGMVWYGRAKECRWIGRREGKSSCSNSTCRPARSRPLVLTAAELHLRQWGLVPDCRRRREYGSKLETVRSACVALPIDHVRLASRTTCTMGRPAATALKL